ncbi:MAG TPA: hypothetical protein VE862_07330 [Candidatus Acidoferrum sp.]|nr:hypothetical protein [Candidatus Acidoferrum sp.]
MPRKRRTTKRKPRKPRASHAAQRVSHAPTAPTAPVTRKRVFPKKAVMIFFIVLTPLLLSYVGYGYVTRPIVEYTFGGANDIRSSYRLDALSATTSGTVDLVEVKIQNIGQSDISVIITLNAVNAEVATGYAGPYDLNTGLQVVLPANSDYRFVPFYITLVTQVSTFSLTCTVSKVMDYSTFYSGTASTFGQLDPMQYTTLQYVQQSIPSDSYKLVQQS